MKAILEFDLEDPDDKRNHWLAINGHKAFHVLQELDNELRNTLKYRDSEYLDETLQYMEALRSVIRTNMSEENIRHDEYSL